MTNTICVGKSSQNHEVETIKCSYIEDDILFEYLTAPWGHRIGLYADGKYSVGPDVGNEICEDEQPIAYTNTPGMGQIDMSYFREGWDCDELSDKEVIREHIEHGDTSEQKNEIIERMIDAYHEAI